jgi:tonB family C-terminal domain
MKYKMETTFSFLRGLLLLAAVGLCTAQTGAQNNDSTKVDESQIFEVAEKNPRFPGGDEALIQWIAQNIQYPATCQEQNIQGRVFASFIVEKDGSITNAKILRSPHPDLSAETLRLIEAMPRWTPGMQGGQLVRVNFSLPILFRLDAATKDYLTYARTMYVNWQTITWVDQAQLSKNMKEAYLNYIKALPDSTLPPIAEEDMDTIAQYVVREYRRSQFEKDFIGSAASFLQKNYTKEQIAHHIKLGIAKKEIVLNLMSFASSADTKKKIQNDFHSPLKNIAKGNAETQNPIAEKPCPDSFRTAFEIFWEDEGVRGVMEKEIINFEIKIRNDVSMKSTQSDAEKEEVGNNMMAYCKKNAPIFWRNLLLNHITEEELRLFDDSAASTIPRKITKEQQDYFHQELLEKFINWNDRQIANNRTEYLYMLGDAIDVDFETLPKLSEKDVYKGKPDTEPSFPGGENAMLQWLLKNLRYPIMCMAEGVEGRVFASFVVDTDGSIGNIKIMRSPHPAMSKEVRRLLRIMPLWSPATKDGKPVRVKYSVPIMFRLK